MNQKDAMSIVEELLEIEEHNNIGCFTRAERAEFQSIVRNALNLNLENVSKEELYAAMNDAQKEDVYRKVWAEHVKEDVISYAIENDLALSNDIIDTVADRYANNGDYDCNLSYWQNLESLINEELEREKNTSDEEKINLSVDNIECTDEIIVGEDNIEFNWDLWFDVDKYFGINTDNDTWVNFYTYWHKDNHITAKCVINSQQDTEEFSWDLTQEEEALLGKIMEEYCQNKYGMTISELYNEEMER